MQCVPEVLKYGQSTHSGGAVLREITCTASAQVSRGKGGAIGLLVTRAGESAFTELTTEDARYLAAELLRLAGEAA